LNTTQDFTGTCGTEFNVDADESVRFNKGWSLGGSNQFFTASAHGLSVGNYVGFAGMWGEEGAGGLQRGFPYYVCTTPSTNSFTVDDDPACTSIQNTLTNAGGESKYNLIHKLGTGIMLKRPSTAETVEITVTNTSTYALVAYGRFMIDHAGAITDLIAATNGAGDDIQTGFDLTDTCTGGASKLCLYDGGDNVILHNDSGSIVNVLINGAYD
jgi:hypothetical protein